MERAPISEPEVAETYRLLARRPPSLTWAKAELFLGLGAVAAGCWLGRMDGLAELLGAGLLALGGYIALAGHRTHLYDAMTRQTTLLRLRDRYADQPASGGRTDAGRVTST